MRQSVGAARDYRRNRLFMFLTILGLVLAVAGIAITFILTADVVLGQAAASASSVAAANASGPCSAAAGSIHMTCQPWPSRS